MVRRAGYLILSLAVVLAAVGGWFVYRALGDLPSRDQLRMLGESSEGTTVYDAGGEPVFSFPTRFRIEIPISSISPNLIKAVIGVEDARFYEHDGVDGVRIIGAILTDLRERRLAEGASTITQQLARMSFLSRDKTLRRKLREAVLAQRIERLYTKDEILELYLNKAYFGDGLYGVEAAAQGYFGKPASSVTIAEGALLAGLLQAPSTKNPVADREQSIERRKVSLEQMLKHRLITKPEYEHAVAEPLVLRDGLRRDEPSGVHFKEMIRRALEERFGHDKVFRGGLEVYSTIDPRMQEAAEHAVEQSLREIDARRARSKAVPRRRGGSVATPAEEPLQAALLALDPETGEVRAVVGGRDTRTIGLNRALQTRRQPGSAFKPFVYAAALESGFSPASVIDQLDLPLDVLKSAWLPDDDHSNSPSMTIRTALRTSSNRAAVRMLETVGIARVVSYAERWGVGTLPSVPSLALGSGEVTLVSMVSAYSAFADRGNVRDPVFIRRVEDRNGSVLFESHVQPRRVVSETTAFLMASMLADVVNAGTANRIRALGFKLPAAGKTGTTNDFVDAWFVGFTPSVVAGVWIGFDQPRPILNEGFAGVVAVPMWTQFMKAATAGDREEWFDPPPGVVPVEVCRVSGHIPVDGCRGALAIDAKGVMSLKSMVYTDYFLRGYEPIQTCEVHAVQAPPYQEPSFAEDGLDSLDDVLGLASSAELPPPSPPIAIPQSVVLPQSGP